jgi:hypothetical protein
MDFEILISRMQGKAENTIGFNVVSLGLLTGELTIEASFKIASPKVLNPNLD